MADEVVPEDVVSNHMLKRRNKEVPSDIWQILAEV